jgi:hypothetical protein
MTQWNLDCQLAVDDHDLRERLTLSLCRPVNDSSLLGYLEAVGQAELYAFEPNIADASILPTRERVSLTLILKMGGMPC